MEAGVSPGTAIMSSPTEHTQVIASSFSMQRAPFAAASIMPISSLTGMNAPDKPPTWPDATQTCIFLVCEKKDQAAVREALRRMNFAAPPLTDMNPEQRVKEIDEEIALTTKQSEETLERIRSYAPAREDIRFASDYYMARAEKYGVLSQLLQSKRVFYLEGFIPAPGAQSVAESIESKFKSIIVVNVNTC